MVHIYAKNVLLPLAFLPIPSWWPHQICSSGYIASRYGNSAMAKTTPVAEWQIGKLEAVTDAVICPLNEFRGADQDYRR